LVAGKKNCSVANILALAGSVLRNWANLAAAIGFLVERMTAVVEPPQLPELAWRVPLRQRGRAPLAGGGLRAAGEEDRAPGGGQPGGVLALVEAAYQASVKSGSVPITPSLASPPQ
jgi:hypothetical protein